MEIGSGLKLRSERKCNPYLGGVFSFDGMSKETLLDKLADAIDPNPDAKETLPDFIFCLNKGYFVMKAKKTTDGLIEVPLGEPFFSYYALEPGDKLFAFFYIALMLTLRTYPRTHLGIL